MSLSSEGGSNATGKSSSAFYDENGLKSKHKLLSSSASAFYFIESPKLPDIDKYVTRESNKFSAISGGRTIAQKAKEIDHAIDERSKQERVNFGGIPH
jgi:hypothetical protein